MRRRQLVVLEVVYDEKPEGNSHTPPPADWNWQFYVYSGRGYGNAILVTVVGNGEHQPHTERQRE